MPRTSRPSAFPLGEHPVEVVGRDLQGDVEVEIVLVLEGERHVRRLEEGEAGAVVELEERCAARRSARGPTRLGFVRS
jgi:hypothetical protein